MERRTLLRLLVHGAGLVVTAVIAVPGLIMGLAPAFRRREPQWRPLGRLADFPTGEVSEARVQVTRDDWSKALRQKGVYVWRVSDDEIVVYSRNCTDLSCPVTFDRGSECFFCPCHGGIFNRDGERMAGPPKRPLYRYANRVREGVVEIDLSSLPAMT